MIKKFTAGLMMMILILGISVPAFAANTEQADSKQVIYGVKSNEQIIDESTFNQFNQVTTRSAVGWFDIDLMSTGNSSTFYFSTGTVRINYLQQSKTYGTVTAKLVNADNGAQSNSITISGTPNQNKRTTLTWSQVPTGNWYVNLSLSPTVSYSNRWYCRGDIYDN